MFSRRIIIAAGLLAIGFAVASTAPSRALAREKANLRWQLDAVQYAHYAVDSQTNAGEETDTAPNLQYVHLLGHEFSADGLFAGTTRPWVLEEILFQLAAHVPGSEQRAGFTWQRQWKFDRVYGTQALDISSSWEFTERAKHGRHDCAKISGTHRLSQAMPEAPSRWTHFEVTTESWFDDESGVLQAYSIRMRASMQEPDPDNEGQSRVRRYHWDATYRLHGVLDTGETEALKKKVDLAITNGVERLWALRNKEGHWPYGSHQRGGTALALLALLMCGEAPDDPRVVEAFALLKETDFGTVYDVAVSIMAYEARYISVEERESFLKGGRAVDTERKLSNEDLAEVQRLMDWLVANRNEPNEMWNYRRDHGDNPARYDYSITQYVLLAFGSAMRCKVSIPTGYLREVIERVRREQAQDGPEVKRVIGYEPGKIRRGKRGEDKVTYSTKSVKARGWGYSAAASYNRDTGETGAYGSMTCAGITCLIAALDVAAGMDDTARKAEFGGPAQYRQWVRNAEESLEGGLTWMEHWFSVTRNPNRGRYWYYYYLYGLERIYMLADIRYAGTHDWYHEGAGVLVTLQDGNGGWGNAVDTSFALLFLKKGTVRLTKPVYTGGPKD